MTDLNFLIAVYQTMRDQAEQVTRAALATQALLDALAEEKPSLQAKYNRHLKHLTTSSPLAEATRESCRKLDVLIQMLQARNQSLGSSS